MTETKTDETLEQVRGLLRKQRYDEAIALLERRLEEDPDCAVTVGNLGTACFAAGRLDAAKAYFEKLTRLRPAEVNAYVNLGAVLNRMKDYRGAIDALRRGLQRDRRSTAAYYNLGIAHRGSGNNAMAVTAYRDALGIDPAMVDAHHNLGNVLIDMGNHQQAITHFKAALEIKPGFEKAKRGLAKAEAAAVEARSAFNPFGRLVTPKAPPKPDEKASHRSQSVRLEAPVQELAKHHAAIHDVTSGIKDATREFTEELRSRLEPAITRLNKTVAQGRAGTHLIDDPHEELQAALKVVCEARDVLLQRLQKLRKHVGTD